LINARIGVATAARSIGKLPMCWLLIVQPRTPLTRQEVPLK
jgi:hypothetical protein